MAQNTRNYSYNGVVQHWSPPAYILKASISASGAQGGGTAGGDGASLTAICSVIPSDTISVAVGGQGQTSSNSAGEGGGGGSFVYDSNTLNLLMVAGGAGGPGWSDNSTFMGGNGGTDIVNNTCPSGLGGSGDGSAGTGGHGGSGGSGGSGPGAGGAGWLSNGGNGVGNWTSYGGNDYANGFAGGQSDSHNFPNDHNAGGFGGGGGGAWNSGGGGGGYNGGGGGNNSSSQTGGAGGASYLNGTLVGSVTATNMGNGSVTISWIGLNVTKNCNGSGSSNLLVNASGGTGAYTYLWSPGGQTGSTITGLSAGTYTLTVTDSLGKEDSLTEAIPATALTSTVNAANDSVCIGNCMAVSITPMGGIPAYSYLWNTGATTDTLNACPVTNTTYTYTVTDSAGCSVTDSITIHALPVVSMSVAMDSACIDWTTDSLTGIPAGGTFSGAGVSGHNFNPSLAGAGTHIITYTYPGGCSTDSAKVTVVNLPLVSASVAQNTTCDTWTTDSLMGLPAGGWFSGAGVTANSNFNPNMAGDGIHYVFYTYSDNLGCSNIDSVKVNVLNVPPISISAAKDTVCEAGTKDLLEGLPAGGTFSGAGVSGNNFNSSLAGVGTHYVTYTYSDSLGCSNADSIAIVVNACTGIKEVSALAGKITFYPNPFSNKIAVNINANGPVTVTMYNMLGQNTGTWQMEPGRHTINTQNMPAGVYMFQVKTKNYILNKKLIKVN